MKIMIHIDEQLMVQGMDVIPTECSIWADGRLLMRDGRFEPEVLAGIEESEAAA